MSRVTIIHQELKNDYASKLLPQLKELEYFEGTYGDYTIKRLQRWYHTKNRYINTDWPIFERWIPRKYTPELLSTQNEISELTTDILKIKKWRANSMLINLYTDGTNIIPKHSDSEHMFGDNPVIAVLSLGATRTIRFTPKKDFDGEIIDIELKSNSLLIMADETQKCYQHELLKDSSITEPRYSLTLRYHVL